MGSVRIISATKKVGTGEPWNSSTKLPPVAVMHGDAVGGHGGAKVLARADSALGLRGGCGSGQTAASQRSRLLYFAPLSGCNLAALGTRTFLPPLRSSRRTTPPHAHATTSIHRNARDNTRYWTTAGSTRSIENEASTVVCLRPTQDMRQRDVRPWLADWLTHRVGRQLRLAAVELRCATVDRLLGGGCALRDKQLNYTACLPACLRKSGE